MSKLKIAKESIAELRQAWRDFIKSARAQLNAAVTDYIADLHNAPAPAEEEVSALLSADEIFRLRVDDVQKWQRACLSSFEKTSQAGMRLISKLAAQEYSSADFGYCYVVDFAHNAIRFERNAEAPEAVAIAAIGLTLRSEYGEYRVESVFTPPVLRFGDWK